MLLRGCRRCSGFPSLIVLSSSFTSHVVAQMPPLDQVLDLSLKLYAIICFVASVFMVLAVFSGVSSVRVGLHPRRPPDEFLVLDLVEDLANGSDEGWEPRWREARL